MGFPTRCSRILLCLLLCVCCSAFSAQSLHNHILLAENTVVLSFLTDEPAAS
ncbi:hypothetical protein BBBOND_0105010 [Babesia bigemina]|uniref:Uncharacterized protein n=1 Tax=Babesia bigemina TaxID=5866 RepID=A0A061D248_BABBI|nr:hypothetical protein BBBOND_0105010 [Babesia bigemina]CDR94192.1 hypothetical protein BBBOND_0105010 [Babesia bigemina]|eukprot:XP_012766378.1 hypothetical protein BBBOND_0105010 [Babesia bigemina]